jgi:hypothetical protein
MQRLFEAYENWLKRSGQVSGTFAPITEILLEMSLISQPASFRADPVRRNFRDYSRIQFSSDLSKLRNPVFNDYRMKLVVATRDSTKKKVQNLWIPVLGGGEGGTHYSHILFKRN